MELVTKVDSSGILGIMRGFDMTREELERVNSTPLQDLHEGSSIVVIIRDDIRHVVKPFESIKTIALKYHVTERYIKEYNGIERVFVGDVIYIESR